MWDMFVQMLMGNGSGQDSTGVQDSSSVSDYKDPNDTTSGMAEAANARPTMGSSQNQGLLGNTFSPYKSMAGDANNIMNKVSNGQGWNTADKIGQPTALASAGNLMSTIENMKPPEVAPTAALLPQPNINLGFPQASRMQGPMIPNPQANRSGLANQAYGSYY